MRSITFAAILGSAIIVACSNDAGSLTGGPGGAAAGGDPPGQPAPAPPNPNDPAQCTSKPHVGFDAVELTLDRVVANVGVDRARIKPFGALTTEYPRVLGSTPASLAGAASTFAEPPARWYAEPQANAVALETAYDVAFDGCLTYTAGSSAFAAAPTTTTAQAQCSALARKVWSKTPTPDEIQACVDVAVTGSASEPAPARRWSYACASVLTAAGFLTY
jgi:hypothetical protein